MRCANGTNRIANNHIQHVVAIRQRRRDRDIQRTCQVRENQYFMPVNLALIILKRQNITDVGTRRGDDRNISCRSRLDLVEIHITSCDKLDITRCCPIRAASGEDHTVVRCLTLEQAHAARELLFELISQCGGGGGLHVR